MVALEPRDLGDEEGVAAGGLQQGDARVLGGVVAGERTDGELHLGFIRPAVPLADLGAELATLKRKHRPRLVVLGPGPGAKPARADLERAGVKVRAASDVDLGAAFAALLARVKAGTVRHRGDANVRLSLERSTPKVLSDGTVSIDRTSGGDDAPIVAMALGAWGVAVGPRSYDVGKSFG